MSGTIRYSILNPNGNITALVESQIPQEMQPEIAGRIMDLHPNVEQVGFVSFRDEEPLHSGDRLPDGIQVRLPDGDRLPNGIQVRLRMAGGEFCGNASLSAAALYLHRMESAGSDAIPDTVKLSGVSGLAADGSVSGGCEKNVLLSVSGFSGTVEVKLQAEESGRFVGAVAMPPAIGISRRGFVFDTIKDTLPLVQMEGISHIMIEPESAFFSLTERKDAAEEAVKRWCSDLGADCLGLMFLKSCSGEDNRLTGQKYNHTDQNYSLCAKNDNLNALNHSLCAKNYSLTPLVYVPGSSTVFWENSCASGSAAAAMYLADAAGGQFSCVFFEPGGQLRAESDPGNGKTLLYGSVELDSVNFLSC